MWINEDYFSDYIDEIQALGYTVTASSAAPVTNTASTPEPFTVEAYEPAKTMWATSEVNCRSGASTSYEKVGSLSQYDEDTNSINTYEFTDTDPEVIDSFEEQLDAEEETIVEETVEETIAEPENEDEIFIENMRSAPYMLVSIGLCVVFGIVAVFMIIKLSKRRRK